MNNIFLYIGCMSCQEKLVHLLKTYNFKIPLMDVYE